MTGHSTVKNHLSTLFNGLVAQLKHFFIIYRLFYFFIRFSLSFPTRPFSVLILSIFLDLQQQSWSYPFELTIDGDVPQKC